MSSVYVLFISLVRKLLSTRPLGYDTEQYAVNISTYSNPAKMEFDEIAFQEYVGSLQTHMTSRQCSERDRMGCLLNIANAYCSRYDTLGDDADMVVA